MARVQYAHTSNMATHMKTTIDVSDALFHAAKELASSSQTTLRALIEEGLRRVLSDQQRSPKKAFKLQNASVGGGALLVTDPRDWQQMEQMHVQTQAMALSAVHADRQR